MFGGDYHNTSGHPASEIKFEWEGKKDDRCPAIFPVPVSRPVPEPKLEDVPPPVSSRYPQPEPEPWWEKIPTLPDWIWGIPGKAIERIWRQI